MVAECRAVGGTEWEEVKGRPSASNKLSSQAMFKIRGQPENRLGKDATVLLMK